ncbi:hypothetical protein LCGC14_1272980 [marine sediment metagenome]|uniref:Uncharacterized protein n=1 Tax=marine sediment metagenome TaxID=412755 RepID=A0A0F9KXH1_9ZZZZ
MFGEEIPGKVKYFNMGALVMILLPYYAIFRVVVLFLIYGFDFVFWEMIPYAGIIFLLSYLFWIGPLKKEKEAQDKANGIDFADSLVKKGKAKPSDFMFGFDEVYELDINFEDDKNLDERLQSQLYMQYLHTLILRQRESHEEKHIDVSEDAYSVLEELQDTLKQFSKPILTEMGGVPITKEALIEARKKLEVQVKEIAKKFEEKTTAIIPSLEKMEILPFTQFDLQKVREEDDFKRDLEFFKTHHFYYVRLYSKENFPEEKDKWGEIFIITPKPYSEVLKTHKDSSKLDGWPINIRLCFCFWTYWWTVARMPTFYLNFSENMIQPISDKLTKINAKVMAYLQLKVMDLWMNDLIVRPEKIIKHNTYLTVKANTFETGFSDLVQDQADMDLKYSQFFKDKAQAKLFSRIEKFKRWNIIISSVSIIVIIMLAITISFLL